MKEHKISPFIKTKRKNCTIFYNAISISKGHPILVKCLTDNTEIKYSNLKRFENFSKIKYSTIKKYLDTEKSYYSKQTKKEYLIFSMKKKLIVLLLEPYAMKVARTVLKGGKYCEIPTYPN